MPRNAKEWAEGMFDYLIDECQCVAPPQCAVVVLIDKTPFDAHCDIGLNDDVPHEPFDELIKWPGVELNVHEFGDCKVLHLVAPVQLKGKLGRLVAFGAFGHEAFIASVAGAISRRFDLTSRIVFLDDEE